MKKHRASVADLASGREVSLRFQGQIPFYHIRTRETYLKIP